ncbi:MAG: hypothetical protein EOO43_02860 [Flavobacterium sp.]|nr:MAG: hypothetical protein EOO43_02860 [Flavobacterium sp.]
MPSKQSGVISSIMVTDSETNFLYLADSLPIKYPKFYKRFVAILNIHKVDFALLPNTKDVWAVDYMPIQVADNSFVQFIYNPDYLQPKTWQKTISDVNAICDNLQLSRNLSNIILDGGNVIKCNDTVIMCDKVFRENPNLSRQQLSAELRELFQIDKLYFVPQEPKDKIGHADGLVRFIDSATVFINDLSKEDKNFERAVYIALENAGLSYVQIPYNPYDNKTYWQANGCYINYLQMKDYVFVPIFGLSEDDIVIKQFENIFTNQKVVAVESNDIANDGGVLNCISWNMKVCREI